MEKVNPIVYQIWLPIEYEGTHNMFHISLVSKSFKN